MFAAHWETVCLDGRVYGGDVADVEAFHLVVKRHVGYLEDGEVAVVSDEGDAGGVAF